MQDKSPVSASAGADLRFEDYEKMCHWLARRLSGKANGQAIPYDDLFQEICIQWCKCRDSFDPTKGVKFSTYFIRSVLPQWRQFRRAILGKHVDETDSLHERFAFDEGEGAELIDTLADQRAGSPETDLLRREAIEVELERNPLLARLTEIAVKPGPDLLTQLEALQAQHAWAAELGVQGQLRPARHITPHMMRKLFNLNWRQRPMTGPICGMIEEMP